MYVCMIYMRVCCKVYMMTSYDFFAQWNSSNAIPMEEVC